VALREGGAALRRGAYREGATFGDLQMTVPLPGRRVPSASAGVGRIERGSEHVCLSHACEVREDERATGGGGGGGGGWGGGGGRGVAVFPLIEEDAIVTVPEAT